MEATPLSLDEFFKLPKPTTHDEADEYAAAFHRIPWPETYEQAKRYLEAEAMVDGAYDPYYPELPPETACAERVRIVMDDLRRIEERWQAKKRATDHPVP